MNEVFFEDYQVAGLLRANRKFLNAVTIILLLSGILWGI